MNDIDRIIRNLKTIQSLIKDFGKSLGKPPDAFITAIDEAIAVLKEVKNAKN